VADVDLGAVSKRENAFWLFFLKKKMLRAGTLKWTNPPSCDGGSVIAQADGR
jgi:hypothetical protein